MDIEELNLSDVNKIFFDISMELFDEFNETLCNINAHLGDIYSYKDLEDVEKAQSEKEIKLLRQAIEKQQLKIAKQEKIINAMIKDIFYTKQMDSICKNQKCKPLDKIRTCRECIAEYYEKKVSEDK